MNTLAILCGFALDLLLGDPLWLPHPVVWMGKGTQWMEKGLRRMLPSSPKGERCGGIILALVLPLVAFGISAGLLIGLGRIHSVLRWVAECWMCYQIFATKELWRQSMNVQRALEKEGLPEARKAVSRIVGRDTDKLDRAGVIKAAVETVAENASDGVVAPLLFMMIGGAPLGMAYKAINTMDSMVGYKNDRYRYFGWAAARLDDAANWIPSRFAAMSMVVSAPLVGLSARSAGRLWWRDGRNHASPNSAQTEAAMAGALGVQLAGDAVYFGKRVHKPTIGDATRSIESTDILRANRLMLASCILALLLCSAVCWTIIGWKWRA